MEAAGPSGVVVIDSGAGTVRGGYGGERQPRVCMPNCTARLKHQLGVLVGEETADAIKDRSQLTLQRPCDRGYVVNWDAQITIWHKMMSRLGANASETSLLLTEPPFPPAPIQEAMNEVIYEEFGFQSSFRCPNMALAVLGAQHLESEAESSPDPIPPCELMVVVDSGFSFTHVAPFYQGRAIPGAVTRLNIGGKLMTNYLMEIVSYRQLNVMDDFQLMSEVKESVCYVARDFNAELRATKRARRGPGRRRGCEFVLPDYKEVLRGYVRDPNDAGQSDQEAQSLFLDSERFSVPELLFNPSDIGVQQAGIPECIVQSVRKCPVELQSLLYGNVMLIGGNSKIPGFKDRVEAELRAEAPDHTTVRVWSPPDPELFGWLGGSHFACTPGFPSFAVTKKEYEENGHRILRFRCMDW